MIEIVDGNYAIRCNCCEVLFDGHDARQPDTAGETPDEAQEKASNYDFFCCDPLHICESCQRKIHERKVSVEFYSSPNVLVDDSPKDVKTLTAPRTGIVRGLIRQ